MNRVTKKFLGKVLPPIGAMIYFAAVMVISAAAPSMFLTIAIPVVFLLIPMFGYMFYESWQDAKREVEWENRDLLNNIKDA